MPKYRATKKLLDAISNSEFEGFENSDMEIWKIVVWLSIPVIWIGYFLLLLLINFITKSDVVATIDPFVLFMHLILVSIATK